MNRSSRRLTKSQVEKKNRRMTSSVHILIAVVAIIECMLLATFTTLSWIESNSSLIIRNGPTSTKEQYNQKLRISDTLNSTLKLNTQLPLQNLQDFFSQVRYFEFAKTTSSDGKTFFFPLQNNTYSQAQYRRGDTIDYNTSYLYFDFIIKNTDNNEQNENYTAQNLDVYFMDDDPNDANDGNYGADIFTISDDSQTLIPEQKTALSNAMRMSITTQVGTSAPNTKIFSNKEHSDAEGAEAGTYNSIGSNITRKNNSSIREGVESAPITASDATTSVSTAKISDYVYSIENNKVTSEKLFVAKKNAETKVSVRIWFEEQDPDFQAAFSTGTNHQLSGADVGVKFAFKTNGNDLCSLYFDDYTFSNVTDKLHITDENDADNYSVWFYAYQPAVQATMFHPARPAGYVPVKLTFDSSSGSHKRWSTNEVTTSMMRYLMGSNGDDGGDDYSTTEKNATGYTGSVDDRYTMSYFCYGDWETKKAKYQWQLTGKPVDNGDFVFNAYSYEPNSAKSSANSSWVGNDTTWQDCVNPTGGTIKAGVGQWQADDTHTAMTLLRFNDMATAVTSANYNINDVNQPNYQFMNAAATNNSNYLVYANNVNDSTVANNFTGSVNQTITLEGGNTVSVKSTYSSNDTTAGVAAITAAMHYDELTGTFESYVPRYWLAGDASSGNKGVSFTYSPTGVYSSSAAAIRWYNASPFADAATGAYTYTALGYSGEDLTEVGYVPNIYSSTNDKYLPGIGTWSGTEELRFSTELIDSSLGASYRYFVGIDGTDSAGYYAMIPDADYMTFWANIPSSYGSTGATNDSLSFVRYSAYKGTANNTDTPTDYWDANARGTYSTFYPVMLNDDDSDASDKGYWNVSVLVDGTYENLVYTTLTDGTGTTVNAPTVTSTAKTVNGETVTVYSLAFDDTIHNYGKLEYTYDTINITDPDTISSATWTTVADDTSNTYSNNIDRFRFYANAENRSTVSWRWTPYKGYEYTTDSVHAVSDTTFVYVHDVASGNIYLVVTEAKNSVMPAQQAEP